MPLAYLILGGNQGNVVNTLLHAKAVIQLQCGNILAYSGLYTTQAWGNTNQPPFINQVLILNTTLTPQVLLHQLLDVEQQFGRVRSTKYAPRIIDIDILYYDNEIINSTSLTLPHPHIASRRFVLVPLTEVAPLYIHPLLQHTNQQLLHQCTDTLSVTLLPN